MNVDQVIEALSQCYTQKKVHFGDPSGAEIIDVIEHKDTVALVTAEPDAWPSGWLWRSFGAWLETYEEEPCLTCSSLANKDACPDCGGTGSFWCDSEGEMRTLAEMQAAYQIQRAQKEKEA
jgi:hypothetical protein